MEQIDDTQLLNLINFYQKQQNQKQLQDKALNTLKDIIQGIDFDEEYNITGFEEFGSYLTNLQSSKSDIDTTIIIKNDSINQKQFLQYLLDQIQVVQFSTEQNKKCHCKEIYNIHPQLNAKKPVINFIHKETDTKIQVSVNNLIGFHNSQLIKTYLQIDQKVKQLCMLSKIWFKTNDLINESMMKSYALVLLCIAFLQKNKYVPYLQTLNLPYQNIHQYTLNVQGKECNIYYENDINKIESHIKNNDFKSFDSVSLLQLFKQFLNYLQDITRQNYKYKINIIDDTDFEKTSSYPQLLEILDPIDQEDDPGDRPYKDQGIQFIREAIEDFHSNFQENLSVFISQIIIEQIQNIDKNPKISDINKYKQMEIILSKNDEAYDRMDKKSLFQIYLILGKYSYKGGKFEQTVSFYEKLQEILKNKLQKQKFSQLKQYQEVIEFHFNYSKLFYILNKEKESIIQFEKFIKIIKEVNSVELTLQKSKIKVENQIVSLFEQVYENEYKSKQENFKQYKDKFASFIAFILYKYPQALQQFKQSFSKYKQFVEVIKNELTLISKKNQSQKVIAEDSQQDNGDEDIDSLGQLNFNKVQSQVQYSDLFLQSPEDSVNTQYFPKDQRDINQSFIITVTFKGLTNEYILQYIPLVKYSQFFSELIQNYCLEGITVNLEDIFQKSNLKPNLQPQTGIDLFERVLNFFYGRNFRVSAEYIQYSLSIVEYLEVDELLNAFKQYQN